MQTFLFYSVLPFLFGELCFISFCAPFVCCRLVPFRGQMVIQFCGMFLAMRFAGFFPYRLKLCFQEGRAVDKLRTSLNPW